MGIFVFFNPFPHTTSIKEISFYLSVVIVMVLVLFKKTEFSFRTPLLVPFGLFTFWSFLSIFWALDVENSFHDFYSHLIRYIILYFIIINFFNSKKSLVCLSWVIIISSTVFSVGGLFYYYLICGKELSARFGLNIFFQTPVNIIGVISIFAIVLALNFLLYERQLYRKVFLAFCLLGLFIGVMMTQERSSLIGLFLAGIIMFIGNKKKIFLLTMFFLIIVAVTPFKNRFSFESFLNNERIPNYYITYEIIKSYPIIGIGFGLQTYGENINLKDYREKIPSKIKTISPLIIGDPHNIVLDVAVRLGVVGLIFFLYVGFVFFKMTWNIVKYGKDKIIRKWGRCLAAALIGVSLIGLFQPIFSHMPEVVFCIIFSMTTIIWRLNEPVAKDIHQRSSD
jgi:putative inorganic carbon (HCO3(-)) transporter